MLTPYPGTPLFERLKAEGRIMTEDWMKYNSRTDVVFQPKNMTPEELLEGFNRANREFYRLGNIFSRLFRSRTNLLWTLPLNLIYHVLLKFNQRLSDGKRLADLTIGFPPSFKVDSQNIITS